MDRVARIKNFFIEVRQEMKQVSWPTRQELISSTSVVFVSVLALAVFLGFCDVILSRCLNLIVK